MPLCTYQREYHWHNPFNIAWRAKVNNAIIISALTCFYNWGHQCIPLDHVTDIMPQFPASRRLQTCLSYLLPAKCILFSLLCCFKWWLSTYFALLSFTAIDVSPRVTGVLIFSPLSASIIG